MQRDLNVRRLTSGHDFTFRFRHELEIQIVINIRTMQFYTNIHTRPLCNTIKKPELRLTRKC